MQLEAVIIREYFLKVNFREKKKDIDLTRKGRNTDLQIFKLRELSM